MTADFKFSIEDEPIVYVKGSDNHWHWFESCTGYPEASNKVEYESHAVIPSNELCKHCLQIELKNSLQSLAVEM